MSVKTREKATFPEQSTALEVSNGAAGDDNTAPQRE